MKKGNETTGTVINITKNGCKVRCEDRTVNCTVPQGKRSTGVVRPVVGDRVKVSHAPHDTHVVEEVMPRRTVLARAEPSSSDGERVIAANVDTAVMVVSVKRPPLHPRLIDRLLAAAKAGGVEAIICVNKIDLLNSDEERQELLKLEPYVNLGIEVLLCSAEAGRGIRDLAELLKGRLCVFIGHSGVGKSSVLNALDPGLRLPTNDVRRSDGKGRHTTTASTLYRLAGGIEVIDTPGVREFGIRNSDNVVDCFPEFDQFARDCRFANCTHTSEPDCCVKLAARDGLIPRARYESYLRLTGRTDAESPLPAFTCEECGAMVPPLGAGSEHRNHCPKCLCSKHLDHRPGDRAACCGGVMDPVAVWVRKGGEWAIIHRCRECGELNSNRIAADDNEVFLISLAVRPLSSPPFPLDRLGADAAGSRTKPETPDV